MNSLEKAVTQQIMRERKNSEREEMVNAILPWDKFSQWLHCICVVTFDLELGQALEFIYPSHIKLSDKEKMNICYLSFPDSNSGCMGDTQFNFRIRQTSGKVNHHLLVRRKEYDRNSPVILQSDPAHLFGFVYFRQVKDKSSRRGYFQKSVVLLSRLPYINLFTELVELIAPEFFDKGEELIEAACHDIDQWSNPVPGDTLQLPIMGTVLQVKIPAKGDIKIGALGIARDAVPQPMGSPLTVVPSLHAVETFMCLQPVLPHIQLLWELVLTNEPLVVMGPSPGITCGTVHALINTISPLKYMTDYRPYFTIHDSEFKEYTTRTQGPPPVILGVTNPFFAKTLQHWPHIVRIGESIHDKSKANKPKKPGSLKTLESKPGVYTQYKSFLSKDKTIQKRLAKGIQTRRPYEVQDAMLRRYLLELTQSFMFSLERYVTSLMPLQRNISPWKHPPRLKAFDIEEFLRTVEHSGPQLTSGLKGDWESLYRRFFKSANFQGWFQNREEEINQKLLLLHLEALSEADLLKWCNEREEVEVVDLVLKLRERLNDITERNLPVKPELIQKLHQGTESIIRSLPEDLRGVLEK